jgi:nucleotide-binding universal stress UspA family protein
VSEQAARPAIVVGIDGSELSAPALRWAVQQARLTHAEVHAVIGWDVPATIYLTPTYTEADYLRDAQKALDSVVDPIMREAPDVPIHKRAVQDRPGLALTGAAVGAALLVIGSHGRGEFPGLHLGSVASYCVHHAPCPVLVFRGAHTGR